MTSSKSSVEDLLGDNKEEFSEQNSWVDIPGACSQGTVTPVSAVSPHSFLASEEYLHLLSEAQRESNQSSAKISLASSRIASSHNSPKSPPNSPVHDVPVHLEWHSYYVNPGNKDEIEMAALEQPVNLMDDYRFDYSSRPQHTPPKYFVFRSPKTEVLSIRHARVGDTSFFSKKGLYALFLTNIISVLVGAGIGIWLSRHGFVSNAVKVR